VRAVTQAAALLGKASSKQLEEVRRAFASCQP